MEESMNARNNILETGRLDKLIARFSIPCVIALIVSALYNIVDQIFIGRGVGYIGNAATSIGFPILVLAQGIAMFFGDGASVFYSIRLGENKKEEAGKAIGNTIVILAIAGILCGGLSFVFLRKLLWSFGATSGNISYAMDYMRLVVLTIPLAVFAGGLSSIIRADGSPEYCMISLLVGTVLN